MWSFRLLRRVIDFGVDLSINFDVCLEYLNKGILIYLLYMDDWSTILVMYMALANFCLLASVVNKYNMKVP